MTAKIGFGILWGVVKGVEGVRYPVKIAVEQVGRPRLGRLYNMLTCQFSAVPTATRPRLREQRNYHCLITRTNASLLGRASHSASHRLPCASSFLTFLCQEMPDIRSRKLRGPSVAGRP
jgi:hypothetical protein